MILHSTISGQGKPFVILHGFLGMGDNWKTMGKQFEEDGFEIHLVDQRNHGRSFQDENFSYDLMSEDLKAYCDHHQLEDIILLGHSMGGKTAMTFATSFPEKVDKLIIADIAPKYYAPHHQQILDGLQALSKNKEALKSRSNADEFLEDYIADWGTRQFLLKNLYWQKDKTLGFRMNLPVLTDKVEAVGEPLDDAAYYEGETLFLRGEKSDYIQDSDFDEIKNQFPNAEIHTIKDAGHWLHAENPEDFYKEVIEFLS